jgi:hypothetical protein
MPRYIAFGAGAIGSILGAPLHRSGQDSIPVGRGPHLQAIRKESLQLMSEGVQRHIKVRAVENLGEIKPRQDDVLLLTVKSQDTEAADKQLRGLYSSQTFHTVPDYRQPCDSSATDELEMSCQVTRYEISDGDVYRGKGLFESDSLELQRVGEMRETSSAINRSRRARLPDPCAGIAGVA